MEKQFLTHINGIEIYRRKIEILPKNKELLLRARSLRKAYNLSEVIFWKQVRNKGFHQIDFDRQRIIGNFIVDFYAKSLGLVIEIDGSSHDFKEDYDEKRQQFLDFATPLKKRGIPNLRKIKHKTQPRMKFVA